MGSVHWKDISDNKLQPGKTGNETENLLEAANVPLGGAGCKHSKGERESATEAAK